MGPSSKVYYPFLDGFRGIAIIMILAHHIRRAFTLDYLLVSNPPILKWIYFKAYEVFGINLTPFYKLMQFVISQLKGVLGVEVFLVISGFLITGMLMRKEIHSENILHFYERRFYRIYPVYCLVVLLSIAIYVLQGHQLLSDGLIMAAYHLVFLQTYIKLHPLLSFTWTLVIFEQFYFFCPLVILAVNSFVAQVALRRSVLIGISIVLMITGFFVRGYYPKTGHSLITWPLASMTPYWTILSNLGPICFGSLLALTEPYWSQWKKSKVWGILFWISGMTMFFYLYFCLNWSYYWGGRFLFTAGYLAVGLLFFAAYHGISLFARLKAIQWIGRCSYGIYIWNYFGLEFWKIWIGTVPPTLIILGAFMTCIVLGALSTYTFERYFLNLRARLVPNI